ncbi:MAG: DNA polymerase III subunit chi [Burkholderiaceae bacterium]
MTRVDVHFNIGQDEKLGYCCRLIRKIYRAGQPVVVYDDQPARLAALDRALWSFSSLDFIPHVGAGDELAPHTPVLLAGREYDFPHHAVLVNLAEQTPTFFSRFDRLIDLVGDDPQDLVAGRQRWRFYTDRGYPIDRHDAARPAGSSGRAAPDGDR